MMQYGYARVSTTDQTLDVQRAALEAAGCDVIRGEQRSGTSMRDRRELETLLQFIREGDVLVVTRIDRLARSVGDLQTIVQRLRSAKAHLRCTEQPVDTTTAAGKAFLDMLGVFAEFETNLRRDRQAEGIKAAKARGAYKGRPPSVDKDRIRQMHADGVGPAEIARTLGLSRTTVWSSLKV